jgi:dipeptidyl aminopeptidase/acylaminoacyl peptidase
MSLLKPWRDELLIVDIAKKTLTSVEGVPQCKKFQVRWSPDGSSIAFGGFLERERAYCPCNVELFVCDLASGKTSSVTAKHDLCFQGHLLSEGMDTQTLAPNYIWAGDSKHLIAAVTFHGERHIVTIGVADGTLKFETCGHYHYELGNSSADQGTIALIRTGSTELPEVFVGDIRGDEIALHQITHINDESLDELQIIEPEEHWIQSADGTKIQLWITRAPETDLHEPMPAVLDIHGGPFAAVGCCFSHDIQVLAAQGYTVVSPNIRGSKGYGRVFSYPLRDKLCDKSWNDM